MTKLMNSYWSRHVRWIVAWLVFGLSALVFNYFYSKGWVLEYPDAVSHLEIARRVVDSNGNNLGQLGGVWLPLPHLLSMPLVWIDDMYYSGMAGSLISMFSYMVTGYLIYRLVQHLTGSVLAGFIGSVVFLLNANVMYMQSTPMTELLLFACVAAAAYFAMRWAENQNEVKYLVGAAIATFLGCLTRYEAWVFTAALAIAIVAACLRNRSPRDIQPCRALISGNLMAFLFWPTVCVLGWMLWNLALFGDPLNFQGGEYARPSLWVGNSDPAVGNWVVSAKTYWYAMVGTINLYLILAAGLGLIAFLAKERFSARSFPIIALTVFIPFFIVALHQGQRPLHVPQINGDLYNLRFGLIMVIPAAVFIGYLAGIATRFIPLRILVSGAVVGFVGFWCVTSLQNPAQRIVTLKEPILAERGSHTQASYGVSRYLLTYYTKGSVLMESFGNELVPFYGRIPPKRVVYEGTYRIWNEALKNPSNTKISWIVMRRGISPDHVFNDLVGKASMKPYHRVFSNSQYVVYRRKGF